MPSNLSMALVIWLVFLEVHGSEVMKFTLFFLLIENVSIHKKNQCTIAGPCGIEI